MNAFISALTSGIHHHQLAVGAERKSSDWENTIKVMEHILLNYHMGAEYFIGDLHRKLECLNVCVLLQVYSLQ